MVQNKIELTIREVVRAMTEKQLTKRVSDLLAIDTRRLTYCLVRDRLAAYKEAKKKITLDNVLIEFGISSKQTYYNWDKKYRSNYEKLQENIEILP